MVNTRQTSGARPALSYGHWLFAVLLCVACGGRTGFENELASASTQESGSGGRGGAQRAVAWDQIIWDDTFEESVVYLWTGSVTDTWAVVAAGAGGGGSFYRDHWDGLRWSRTLHDQSDRFDDEQIWAVEGGQAVAGSSENLQRWSATPWIDWQQTPGCRAIGGSAPDDIWCATENELWRFDGASWSHQIMSGIRGILANARDDVWVWGTQGASHFDGKRWSLERANLVSAVSTSVATDVWALQDGDLLHCAGPGTAWTRQNPTGSSISGLWSPSKTNTWIVAAGAAMRWDGSNWQLVPLPNQDERLLISGSSEDVWIAGTTKLIHGHPTPR